MSQVTHQHATDSRGELRLSPQQIAYFETFGFLKLPGLFREEIAGMAAAFDEVFANEPEPIVLTEDPLQQTPNTTALEKVRIIVPALLDKSDDLRWVRTDPRVLGIVRSLMGDGFEYAESDGSRFNCETNWHPDFYGAPLDRFHVKLSFYLEPLREDTGAIRLIPGSNHHTTRFATALRRNLWQTTTAIKDSYGVGSHEIPSWPLESDPGDVVVWNYRTIHASFYGGEGRRLMSVSFREVLEDA